MQRRNFLKGILRAGAGFAILPSAMLYARKWKFERGLHTAESEWVESERPVGHLYREIYFYDMPPMFDERILMA